MCITIIHILLPHVCIIILYFPFLYFISIILHRIFLHLHYYERYGFVYGQDFITNMLESIGGRPSIEYALTVDAAKELSMVKGNVLKAIRNICRPQNVGEQTEWFYESTYIAENGKGKGNRYP